VPNAGYVKKNGAFKQLAQCSDVPADKTLLSQAESPLAVFLFIFFGDSETTPESSFPDLPLKHPRA